MEIHNFEDILNFIKENGNDQKKCEEFGNNFKNYLTLCNAEEIVILMHEMINYEYARDILCSYSYTFSQLFKMEAALHVIRGMNFEEGLNYIASIYTKPFMNIDYLYFNKFKFLDALFSHNENEFISNNMAEIIRSFNIDYLIRNNYLTKLKNTNPKIFSKIHSVIVTQLALNSMNRDIFRTPIDSLDSKTTNALTIIFDEIAENEKTDLSEIEYIGLGHFSQAYKLGNKVFKLGTPKTNYEIPYHRRLLQPLIRREVLKGKLYIEIAEYLKPDKSISEEDVYTVFKELRDDGILWFDARPQNLGRLQKDNIIHFNSPLNIENDSVGLLPLKSKNNSVLSKGDLVIIDLDFLFKENDLDGINTAKKKIRLDDFNKYEKRYQNEKSREI